MKNILVYVQSSYGLGHLFQVIKLASWLSEYRVDIVYGGQYFQQIEIPENARLHRLSPVRENQKRELEAVEGKLEEIKKQRKKRLLKLFRDLAPEILFVEQFPFGRFRFESEIKALLEYAKKKKTPVFCMKAGVKQRNRDPRRNQKIKAYLDRYYSKIFVFSDPETESLRKEIPLPREKIIYLGYLGKKT